MSGLGVGTSIADDLLQSLLCICSTAVAACREELFEEIMGERDDVASKRTACQAALTALREALHAVDSVPQALLSRINSPHR